MEKVKLSFEPPAATLTLNKPEIRNALSPDLMADCQNALDEVRDREDIAGVIITGQGKVFSAGADLSVLKELTAQSVEEARHDSAMIAALFKRIYEFPKPVIAAINGHAIGGGCGLASVCDILVAVEGARFGYTESKVGFIPALVSVFLTRICGEKRARDLLLTARIFSAQEAKEYGLVNEIVPEEQLFDRAREIVGQIAENSPIAVTFTKELMRDLQGLNLNESLAAALQLNTLIRTTEDFKEGVSSFLDKRKPEWKRK